MFGFFWIREILKILRSQYEVIWLVKVGLGLERGFRGLFCYDFLFFVLGFFIIFGFRG